MITPTSATEDEETAIVATLPQALREAFEGYVQALDVADLASSTRRVYRSRVAGYLGWLTGTPKPAAALRQPQARNEAVSGYQRWLREDQQRAESAINAVLTAVDHFYKHLGLGAAVVSRDVPAPATTAPLSAAERATVDDGLGTGTLGEAARERVVVHLMLYAGLSGAEISALDLGDVHLSGRHGAHLTTPGGTRRTVPLHPALVASARAWLRARRDWPGADASPALLVNRFGERLGSRSVTGIVQSLGERTGVALTPATLRTTFLASLADAGTDPLVVSALTGRRVDPAGQVTPDLHQLRAAVAALPGGER